MSVNSVLSYFSMEEVRSRINENNWLETLEALYSTYSGCDSLAEKQMIINNVFDAHPVGDPDDRAYLIYICHMIWVEDNGKLSWSLRNISRENIRLLAERTVDFTGWSSDGLGLNGCWGGTGSDFIEPVSREWYKAFPLARFLAEGCSDQGEALKSLLKWEMKNFFHAYVWGVDEDWGWDHYDTQLIDWDIPLEAYFRERIIGCHGGAKILCAMLRSINIPAIELHYAGHGITYLPTLNRYVHGDYIADMNVLPDPSLIIMTLEDLEGWIFTERGYLSYWDYLNNAIPHLSNRLRRSSDNLFVSGNLPGDASVRGQIIRDLEEYRLPDRSGGYTSAYVPIQTLDALPNYVNLHVADIGLDENNFLRMWFRNDSDYFVPFGRGNLLISIDDKLRGGYGLWILADQSFREPRGELYLRTNFRLKGNGREIRLVLKGLNGPCLEDLIYEEVINAPIIDGVDLTVQDIALDDENKLYFKAANLGTQDTAPGLRIRVRIIVQGQIMVDFDKVLDEVLSASAANFQNIYPPDPIIIDRERSVSVFMHTFHALEDLDNTNNSMNKIISP